ncbi:MAG: hypothetical protein QOK38_820, partial [Acidobacteriaceae bacterium]|nr:hypothetical protein [Acidobacteriaceae bacterium]
NATSMVTSWIARMTVVLPGGDFTARVPEYSGTGYAGGYLFRRAARAASRACVAAGDKGVWVGMRASKASSR